MPSLFKSIKKAASQLAGSDQLSAAAQPAAAHAEEPTLHDLDGHLNVRR
jgi:hypothetical protein